MLVDMRTETPKPDRRALLVEIMTRLPNDPAAEISLYQEFGDELRACLVTLARQHGLIVPRGDALDDVTWDACGEIRKIARSWRPDGGAKPWTYARRRLVTLLFAAQGPRSTELPDADRLVEAPSLEVVRDERPVVEVLDELAHEHADPIVRVLRTALDRVGPRDRELVLLYAQQLAVHDPTPAVVVGALVDRSPAAVRQAFCRARRKLRQLALDDHAFRPLLALPMLADPSESKDEAA